MTVKDEETVAKWLSHSSSVRLVLLPLLHTKRSPRVETSAVADSGHDHTTHVKPPAPEPFMCGISCLKRVQSTREWRAFDTEVWRNPFLWRLTDGFTHFHFPPPSFPPFPLSLVHYKVCVSLWCCFKTMGLAVEGKDLFKQYLNEQTFPTVD